MTDHVHQRGRFDCTVACMAMFLDRSYEDVVAMGEKLLPGWNIDQAGSLSLIHAICERLGTPVVTSRYFVDGAPQILCLMNGAPDGFHHAVFWNGRELFDPNPVCQVTEEYARSNYFDSTIAIWDFAPVVLESVLRYQRPTSISLEPR